MRQLIIAEAGVNHNGDINLAYELVIKAKECGADAVKFQTFKAEKLAGKETPKVPYQTVDRSESEESHFEMLKRLELSEEDTIKVKKCCDENEIEFMSTPYDIEGVDFLSRIGSKRLKVASADLVDFRIQRAVRATGLPVIQSMGMATEEEVIQWHRDYLSEAPIQHRTLLQCTSNYPSDPFNSNVRAMKAIGEKLGVDYGFSDHTPDERGAVLAVALGAKVIEKHFTLDKSMEGPDHRASVNPSELSAYVQAIRDAEIILGSEHKSVCQEEMDMRRISRKGAFAKRALELGSLVTEGDFDFHRPGTAMDMGGFLSSVGKRLKKGIEAGEALSQEHIE